MRWQALPAWAQHCLVCVVEMEENARRLEDWTTFWRCPEELLAITQESQKLDDALTEVHAGSSVASIISKSGLHQQSAQQPREASKQGPPNLSNLQLQVIACLFALWKSRPASLFCEGVKIKLTAVSSYFSDILAHFPHVAQDAISFLLPFGKLQKSWPNEIDLVELVLTVIRMRWTLLNLSCRALLDTLVSHNPSNGSDFSKMICLDLPIHSLLHGFNTAVAE